VNWAMGPTQIVGFNYYPSVRISGSAKPGYTSGDAIQEMERLASQLPRGFGYEWTGQSLQEKLSGSQAPFLLALSVLLVFLVLAALYESWTIPLAVLLGYRSARWAPSPRPHCEVCRTTSISQLDW
jgi:multidrug efflux pump